MAATSQAAGSAILPGFFSASQSRCSIWARISSSPWSRTRSPAMAGVMPRPISSASSGDGPGAASRGGGPARERLDLEHGRPAAAGERPVLGPGLRAGRVEHDPVGVAVAVDRRARTRPRRCSRISGAGRGSSPSACRTCFQSRLPRLRGIGAELGIRQLGPRPVVLEGRVHPVAEQLVEPLRGRGQALEVVVIEGPRHRPVDDLHVNITEDDIDGIGLAAVGQLLAGEDDAVAGEIRLQRPLRAVGLPVPDLRRDAGEGVLAEGIFDRVDVLALR